MAPAPQEGQHLVPKPFHVPRVPPDQVWREQPVDDRGDDFRRAAHDALADPDEPVVAAHRDQGGVERGERADRKLDRPRGGRCQGCRRDRGDPHRADILTLTIPLLARTRKSTAHSARWARQIATPTSPPRRGDAVGGGGRWSGARSSPKGSATATFSPSTARP